MSSIDARNAPARREAEVADENDELRLSAFGSGAAAKGTSAIMILVLMIALGASGYMLYERSRQDREVLATITKTLTEHASNMRADHTTMIETSSSTSRQLKIQNYIILADPQEKAEIKRKLGRPAELQ